MGDLNLEIVEETPLVHQPAAEPTVPLAEPVESVAAQPHRLILLSMVKNESRIIERLMNSVRGRADAIVICDTGSTDNTPGLVRTYLETNVVPGELFTFPFETFGASRTRSFECCQEFVKARGWDASRCWALLLDGDMMLPDDTDPAHFKGALAAAPESVAGISLKQENGSLIYSNVRVVRCSEPWICKGATHEAWTCPPNRSTQLLDRPVLRDLNDGGCKSDKYERDVRLLLQDLSGNPNDSRTLYYLGQTYLCMRDWPNAVETFRRRIEVGGWDEETYIAQVHLGDSLLSSGKEAEAVATWLKAWQYRQHRTEAPMRLVSHYRKKPHDQFLAMMFLERLWVAQKGETLEGEPRKPAGKNNDLLFVNARDMAYHVFEEMGILGYYSGNQRAVWLRHDELDLANALPWHDFNTLFGNLKWYDWTLRPRRQTRFAIPLERLPWAFESEAGCWQPFNPSIRINPARDGYWLNLRFANYYTNEAKHYGFRAFQGQVLTRNCFCQVPREAGWNTPAKIEEIKIDPKFPQKEGHHIRGIEDCRWIQNSDRQEFLGTSQSYSENGTNKIFHVWRDAGETTWSLRQMPLPEGVSPQETQKNWLGFRENGSLNYLYNYSPFQVCKESGERRMISPRTVGADGSALTLREYRGSAGPAEWRSEAFPEERWLCVIHKVYHGGDGRRYYHRFMTLDAQYRPSRVSCFVRMTQEKVEYWSGMCPSLEGDSYWVVYGLKDSEAYIAEMRTSDIEPLLFYSFESSARTVPVTERLRSLSTY